MHMKKFIQYSLWIVLCFTGLASCEKPGPEGPRGADGEQGVAGVNGQNGKDGKDGKDGQGGKDGQNGKDGKNGTDGNMKIISKEFSFTGIDWEPTPSPPPNPVIVGYRAMSSISQITDAILNSGAVLIYHKTVSGFRLIPYSILSSTPGVSIWSEINPGRVLIHYSFSEPRRGTPGLQNFRAVIIPGAISGRVQSGNGIGWDINQLKQMSYEELCATLNIEE